MVGTAVIERPRSDIDRGRTRDKVRVCDPAAAPLGVDEEVAGTPLTHEHVELARRSEGRPLPEPQESALAALGAVWLLLAASVITGVALLAAVLARA